MLSIQIKQFFNKGARSHSTVLKTSRKSDQFWHFNYVEFELPENFNLQIFVYNYNVAVLDKYGGLVAIATKTYQ